VVNVTESLFTMAMDVLEGYGRGAEVMELYAVRAAFGLKPSKSCFKFAMQACASDRNVDGALLVLRDAQACSLDSPSMYNMTVILADAKGRNEEAITVLLQPASSPEEAPVFPPKPSNMPPVWVTREIISNALIALTRNFSASFTEIVDGRLAASDAVRPFVSDLTDLLKYTVLDRKLYLFSASYPMANKLLLDSGDHVTLRALLNHTLYMQEVNSTRLYDFAVRSLARAAPVRTGLSTILLLMGDLCDAQYYDLASQLFIFGLNLVCVPLSEMAAMYKKNQHVPGR